jgi:hypothetical protein
VRQARREKKEEEERIKSKENKRILADPYYHLVI